MVDFTLVIVGPSDLCAPEQFEQRKTPKSKEAPMFIIFLQFGEILLQSAHALFDYLFSMGVRIFSCSSNDSMNINI